MSGSDKAYLFYMVILLVFIAGSFLYSQRDKLSQTLQQAMIWGLIFVGTITAYGFSDVFKEQIFHSTAVQNGTASVTLSRANDGHFYASLKINDSFVEFVIDTGASAIVLTKDDAQRVGIDTDSLNYLGQAQTANGTVSTAYTRLGSVALGDIIDYNLSASVNGGELFGSLLGMDYLNLFSEFRITGNTLTLTR
jgi:aspartyl protease family protein